VTIAIWLIVVLLFAAVFFVAAIADRLEKIADALSDHKTE